MPKVMLGYRGGGGGGGGPFQSEGVLFSWRGGVFLKLKGRGYFCFGTGG